MSNVKTSLVTSFELNNKIFATVNIKVKQMSDGKSNVKIFY